MRAYERWNEAGKDLVPDDDEGDERPDTEADALVRARRARKMRTAALVVILLVCALSLYSTRQEAAYFFADSKATEIGNVRDLYAEGKAVADVAGSNSYVHVEGLAITQIAETEDYVYFLCPISNIIVRTRRDLPEKSRLMTIPMDERLVQLVQERRLFPHDLTASFEATGRLIQLSTPPGWARNIVQFYAGSIRTPLDRAFLLVDEEEPADNVWYVVLYGVAVLLIASAVVFLVRAVRRERELQRRIERGA
jgi:hypothetical protein